MNRRIDAAWLAAFRILFGCLMAASMGRFLAYGWVSKLWGEPHFHFAYWGFGWLAPLPQPQMQGLFAGLLLLAVAIALGACFRVTAPAFTLGLAYIQLLDVSTYLNHYYLAALLCLLLSFSPANQLWSVDAWVSARYREFRGTSAAPRSSQISVRWLYLLRFQVGVVYAFAGLAKAQSDWLVHAQPLRTWLGANVDLPLIGPWLSLGWVPLLFSWSGFLFDLTIVGWLLWRRTRLAGYLVLLGFHAITRLLFPIGMFPFIMAAASLCFFEPNWPRSILHWVWRPIGTAGGVSIARSTSERTKMQSSAGKHDGRKQFGWALAVLYCVVQVALPLRNYAYAGDVLWHEQGMRFSWRVMLRAKGGSTTFLVRQTSSGKLWHVSPARYLTPLQESEMSGQPDLILQLAQHIAGDFKDRGYGRVEVRAESLVSLNGRRSAQLVDPNVDLSRMRDGVVDATWILPKPDAAPRHTRVVL